MVTNIRQVREGVLRNVDKWFASRARVGVALSQRGISDEEAAMLREVSDSQLVRNLAEVIAHGQARRG